MSFYNAGALVGSTRPPTKKALREAVKANPTNVYFDGTALTKTEDYYRADQIPAGVTVVVVGPNPFVKRSWYANVTRRGDQIKVV